MYKVKGADQNEYGPVTAEQLRQWITEHRLNAQSLVRLEGTESWRPLSEFPEFAVLLASSSPAPPLGPIGPLSTYAPPPATNSLAITGLIMGCFSFICCQVFGIVGIIFSAMALSQIKENPGQGGKGMAITGLVLSILSLVLIGVLAAFGALGSLLQQLLH